LQQAGYTTIHVGKAHFAHFEHEGEDPLNLGFDVNVSGAAIGAPGSPLINLAILHYQFESIHPFYDGNGRTGRILNILFFILNELIDLPILYLSSFIIDNKPEYYRLMNKTYKTGQ